MADQIHEFYNNDSLGFSDLSAGVNIASTNANQKAVIRDIRITNPASKSLSLKLGNHVLGTATATETFSGTELLKENQNITLSSSDSLLWTGFKYSNTYSARQYSEVKWNSDWYFKRPQTDEDLTSESGWSETDNERYRQPHHSNSFLHNYTDFSNNEISVWPAKELFGRDDKDYYYTQSANRAIANSATWANKLYYYDHSADTSTQIYAGSSSNGRRAWHGLWSNRYMILPDDNGGNSIREFGVLDTTDNTVTANRTIIRGYDAASNENRIEDVPYNHYYLSICNKYAFIKHKTENNSSRIASLLDVTTGRYATWDGDNDHNNYQSKFMSNDSSYNNYPTSAQIAQSDNGKYYVMWMWMRGSSNDAHGMQLWCLGDDPFDKYLKLGATAPHDNYPEFRWNASSDDIWGHSNYWAKFTINNVGNGGGTTNKKGYFKGFFPLKQLSPTDAKCRYWGFNGQDISLIIDLEAEDNTGVQGYQFKYGTGSGSDTVFNGLSSQEMKPENAWPIYDTTKAASGWGTVGVRTTGILST